MALHALAYCERLYFLEEVEEIRLADERVYAGRVLHETLPDEGPLVEQVLESSALGIRGRFDAVRRRDGRWCVMEHKRGRSCAGPSGPIAWDSDRVQVIAYGLLLAEKLAIPAEEIRCVVRYHADQRSVEVAIDDAARQDFAAAVARAGELRELARRPPPTSQANRCLRCSLAPVCLPEEERLARDPGWEGVRLFPAHPERLTLHVLEHGDRIGRSGERLVVKGRDDAVLADHPAAEVGQLVVHGNAQLTTQALTLCLSQDIQVHWLTAGGRYLGGTAAGSGGVQRRLRQYQAMSDPVLRLNLARRLTIAKVRDQLRHLLRVARQEHRTSAALKDAIAAMRPLLGKAARAADHALLLGVEGEAAARYWGAFAGLLLPDVDPLWRPAGRTRRPPRDACNALLSFLYQLLYRDCVAAILAVGLEPSLGFHHRPRSQSYPLAEDLMELFRVPLVDLPVVASLNRRQWTAQHARDCGPGGWLLTDEGRKQAIRIYEERKTESWKHPVTGYSLSYARLIELEVRLLEKEYDGEPGLFAKRNLR